jgi:hypothetical protein
MNKTALWIQGIWMCLSGVFTEVFANCVDLKFWQFPTHADDLIWYAERVNGRLAMLALVFVLQFELLSHESIWKTIGVIN